MREVVSKTDKSLGVILRAGKLFEYPHALKSYFKAYVLFSLEHYTTMLMSSAESHLGLLGSVVRGAEMLSEAELYCLSHRRNASALCLLYKSYHRVDHPMNEYLHNFVAARIIRALSALGELALVI